MHQLRIVLCALAAISPLTLLWGQQPPASAPTMAAPAGQDGCKAYYSLAPLDPSVLQLLGTPVVPANPALVPDAGFRQLRDWDLPSKVTPWSERPSAAEMARRRDELVRAHAAGQGVARPYELGPLPPRDWQDLEKWFAKEGPKKLPGICVDRERAGYVLALGLISDGSPGASLSSAMARTLYGQSTMDKDSSQGPNAGSQTPGGTNRPAQELSGMSDSSRPGVYTCTYLYRATAGARQATPEYYYCHAGDDMPKSAVTTMLKYLAKRNP